MKIVVTLDTDHFDFAITPQGEVTSSKEVRQLISLARLAVADLQIAIDKMLTDMTTFEQARAESKRLAEEAAKQMAATVQPQHSPEFHSSKARKGFAKQ